MAAEKVEMKRNQLMPPHACCEFFAVHELRAVKPLALGWMSNMTLVFSVHIPLCMSASESCRMNPQQLEVHDLPSNTSAASGSPHGNLLMSALSLPSISVSLPLCHICKGEKFDPGVLHNHILSFFTLEGLGLWLWHPGTSDLSWVCNEHQPLPPHSVSGSRPKWHVM